MYTSDILSSLKHGFFTRKGGVSKGVFDSLNFAVTKGDDIPNVIENRKRALVRLGLENKQLLTFNQVHGIDVVIAKQGWDFNSQKAPNVDAIITQNPDFVIGILTADCVPILFFDEKTNTIAAVHAGWKGVCTGIIASVMKEMKKLGVNPQMLQAAIGPCIGQEDYEVGIEVYNQFVTQLPETKGRFKSSAKTDHFLLDLTGVVFQQLKQEDVSQVEVMGLDTYRQEEDFFSCRRAFHRKEPSFGCMLSAISLVPA